MPQTTAQAPGAARCLWKVQVLTADSTSASVLKPLLCGLHLQRQRTILSVPWWGPCMSAHLHFHLLAGEIQIPATVQACLRVYLVAHSWSIGTWSHKPVPARVLGLSAHPTVSPPALTYTRAQFLSLPTQLQL